MILTVGHNYCKLNDSADFYNMMNALFATQGGDVEIQNLGPNYLPFRLLHLWLNYEILFQLVKI